MLELPEGFDFKAVQLDAAERHIRDVLNVNVENWVKFRHVINIGNNAKNLSSQQPIADEVKASYRELAKSHYEVVSSMGGAVAVLRRTEQEMDATEYFAHVKGVYFHFGCVLDNLARLIFIINDPDAPTRKRGKKFLRHWIDWGSLEKCRGYEQYQEDAQLKGIINIRNTLAHSWKIPMMHHPDGTVYWPIAARTERDHPWPYDEIEEIHERYQAWTPLRELVFGDCVFVEGLQSRIFDRLIRDVPKFERAHSLTIT